VCHGLHQVRLWACLWAGGAVCHGLHQVRYIDGSFFLPIDKRE
jgi:hypothetical protein